MPIQCRVTQTVLKAYKRSNQENDNTKETKGDTKLAIKNMNKKKQRQCKAKKTRQHNEQLASAG